MSEERRVVKVFEYGPIFELVPPWTLEKIKASIVRCDSTRKPLRCRIKHSYQKIGTTYMDEKDLLGTALSLIASRAWDGLYCCKRCGWIGLRSGI